jgi:ribosomal-protein-alanine N-acetyltransferase
VHYRPYRPEDFDQLYAIEEVCFSPRDRFSSGYMRQLILQPNAATWIAEENERMCGFALAEWAQEPSGIEAYIQTLEVMPQARGQGVGGELLRALERSARGAGAEAMWLHVEATNGAAIRLYAAHGYELEGREEGYYGRNRTALIYAKSLRADEPV